jgi:hypothetical protein
MPHLGKDNKLYMRTTEIVGALECEEKLFHAREQFERLQQQNGNGSYIVNSVATMDAIIGTLAHHKIESFILKKYFDIDHGPPRLGKQEQALLYEIEQEEKTNNALDRRIGGAVMNFVKFWEDFNPDPLAVERLVMGTVDGVPMKGSIDLTAALPENVLDKLLNKVRRRPHKRIILIDWKTGTYHDVSHRTQLACYYELAKKEFLGKLRMNEGLEYYTYDGVPYGMDVYLGGDEYKVKVFPLKSEDFFATVGIFKRAKRVPHNRLRKTVGKNGQYCLYCPFRGKCSSITEGLVDIAARD